MSRKILMAATVLMTPSAALASSPSAWDALNADVARRCAAASKLEQARSGQVIGFDDTLGKFVTLVTGKGRLAKGKKVTISMLCVHDPQSGRTWVAEAQGWKSPLE